MTSRRKNNKNNDFSQINEKSSDSVRNFSLTRLFSSSNASNFNTLEEDEQGEKKSIIKPRKFRFLLCCSSSSSSVTNPIKIRKKSWKRVKEMDQMDKICSDIEDLSELEKALEDSSSFSSSEEACKEFRKYLIEMVVEEKDARDLMDVEELLSCFRNLRSPLYKDLIGRFYVEVCMDIFAPKTLDDISSESISIVTV